jgi:tRNA-splicing ligase RtcB
MACGFFAPKIRNEEELSNEMATHDNELETYYHQMQLPTGNLHVYASGQLFSSFDYKIFEMANNNLQIPNNLYMSYTPDVHVGVGTCIGTRTVGLT